MIDKPDLMTDALAITTVKEKKKGMVVVEDKQSKASDSLFEIRQSRLPGTKSYKEDWNNSQQQNLRMPEPKKRVEQEKKKGTKPR